MCLGKKGVLMGTQEYGKIISRNLRRIASDANKTQADIARDLRINKATVSSWMNGTRVPRMDKVDLLASYFNVSRTDIMEEYSTKKRSYYLDPETAQAAQELFDNSDLRALLDAARGNTADNLKLATEMLTRMKGTNPNG